MSTPRRTSSTRYGQGAARKSQKELNDAAVAHRAAETAVAAVLPSLPSDEEEKRLTAKSPETPTVGDLESNAMSQQILNFLLGVKTLKREGVQTRQELEKALYAKRFELLFPEKESTASTALTARAPLLQFHSLPQQQLLKEFLMMGKLHGGHQSVAHVLYPEAVHWPHELGMMADEDDVARRDLGHEGAETQHLHGLTRRGSTEAVELEDEGNHQEEDEEKVEVVLCGKRVHSTVRGRALKDALPEKALVSRSPRGVQPLPEARFRAAQDTRKNLERAVKMEEYQERRLAERIQALEIALDDELWHQEELQKRQKQRDMRQVELRRDMEKGIAQKIEMEKAQREEEKRQKEMENREKERLERYYKAQKEKVEQWQAEMSSEEFFQDPAERARKKRLALQKDVFQNALAEQERKNQKPPLKRLEVEAKLQEQEECIDQRPYVAPKAHDQPRPILQMIADTQAKAKPKAVKASPGEWRKEAKGVAKRYGLSAENLRTIETHLQRTAGRFRPQGPPTSTAEMAATKGE